MLRRPLDQFLLKTLLWLIPAFVAWYLLGPILLVPTVGLTHLTFTHFFSYAVSAVEQQGGVVDVVTRFTATASVNATTSSGLQGDVVFTINALKYAYGVPLFLGLILATPSSWRNKLKRSVIGYCCLIPIQTWGLVCDALVVLVFKLDHSIGLQMGTTPLTRELLALSYQLGFLILPAIAPLLIWAFLSRDFLKALLPNYAAEEK